MNHYIINALAWQCTIITENKVQYNFIQVTNWTLRTTPSQLNFMDFSAKFVFLLSEINRLK